MQETTKAPRDEKHNRKIKNPLKISGFFILL